MGAMGAMDKGEHGWWCGVVWAMGSSQDQVQSEGKGEIVTRQHVGQRTC